MAAASTPDEVLLERVAAGDREAFSAFYRRHLDGVVAFFRRRVPEPELAFDLTAETFAAVIGSAQGFSGGVPATAWLYGIARNKLRDSLRARQVQDKARRRLGVPRQALDDEALERVEQRAVDGEQVLHAAMAALPEPVRRALCARVVEEREYPEIAEELEVSEQVVRQRVHRGLARLRAAMGAER